MKHSTGKINPGQLWKLFRGYNLIFIALTQYMFKFLIIDSLVDEHMISFSDNFIAHHRLLFLMLVLSTVFVAAAGYVINDIYDTATDKINRPGKNIVGTVISENQAKTLYHSLNILGISLGFFTFFALGKPSLVTVHLLVSAMLYLYAVKHQCNGFLGNVFVSFSTSLTVLLVWLFEFYSLLINQAGFYLDDAQSYVLIFGYAVFAFVFTLLREWAKDLEDMEGDRKTGCRNFIVKQGTEKGKRILAVAIVVSSVLVGVFQYFLLIYNDGHTLFNALFVTIIVINLVYALPLTLRGKTKNDFKKLSSVLRLQMLNGIIYMLFFLL
jgi:4-hydroxybenzoate polyprenyltransferase